MPSHKYEISFLRRAAAQYAKALAYYQELSIPAAIGFINDVDKRTDMIQADPSRYRSLHKDFFEVSLIKYPYMLIYRIDEINKIIFISSVHHHKQNQKRKYRR